MASKIKLNQISSKDENSNGSSLSSSNKRNKPIIWERKRLKIS